MVLLMEKEVYRIYRYITTELNGLNIETEVLCEDQDGKTHKFTTLMVKSLKSSGHKIVVGNLQLVYNWNVKVVDNQVVAGEMTPELLDLFHYIQQFGAGFMYEKINPRVQRKIDSINTAVNHYLAYRFNNVD